ncbi:hypothetical protein P691DRAFT_774885 [Macrolepiota fuliginosa MF-IS2]|uniref:Uncharacterized protein n=1 Tax=Macrolepiota fuliginosa MF-IS2 TaxID=1400762 RepID=A0A9P5XD37_9AGAR|nr:hypothetical protein P691DRAFT_774885 [Macrolepiota fuliginosa MF-IS2]
MASLVSLPPTTTNSVVFPPPPPTTNTLTPEQRTQLRKSTKKLGHILGATPHLLDTDVVSILGPVYIQLPSRNETSSPVLSDSSSDSYSSTSYSTTPFYSVHPYAACASPDSRPSTPSPSRQNSLRKSSSGRLNNTESTSIQAPLLRLAVSPPSPISSSSSHTSSPPRTSAKFNLLNSHTRSTSFDSVSTTNSPSDMRFTLRPARHSTSTQSRDSISEPSLNVPSPSTSRRQKMDRLRKMLGEEVPVHLVFPSPYQKPDDSGLEDESDVVSFGLDPIAVAGTAVPRPKKASAGKIVGARDSMGTLTPHRAKRQEKQKLEKPKSPMPPSPPTISASSIPKDSPQKQLCVIVESPEEHGTSPFEGFGFGGSATKRSTTTMQASWHAHGGATRGVSGLEDPNRVWSTRRGYAGWDRSMMLGKSEQERKRAMSYRKPPPAIDF